MWSQDLYISALEFAAEHHNGQSIPDTDLPYVSYLSMVAAEVLASLTREPVGDPDLAVQCALLHDILEDTAASLDELTAKFGPRVAAAVVALTEDPKLPRDRRLAETIERVRAQPREVWLSKLAARITRLQRPPASWTREEGLEFAKESLEVHRALGEASPTLAARLAARVTQYSELCEKEAQLDD